MRNARGAAVAAVVAILLAAPIERSAAQATQLVVGMELVYESNGTPGNPWRVELVERDVARGDRTGCLRIRFAPGGPRRDADERVTCEADGMLFAWDSTAKAWRASRPVRANGTLDVRGATTLSRYSTTTEHEEVIGDLRLRVVETSVVTTDSAGTVLRRLRERYAPELGTATWGAFEVPDPGSAGGWRTQQEFTLVAIRRPAR